MRRKENLLDLVLMFFRGILVGLFDIVPGISGGTILFISGVYERFVEGLKNVGIFLKEFFLKIVGRNKSSFKKVFRNLDFTLFVPLIFGIWTVLLLGSGLLLDLMDLFPSQVFSFFIGLILSSTFLMYKEIGKKNVNTIVFLIIGVWIGFVIGVLSPEPSTSASYLMIALAGAVSICAMVLPGISGSYLLILMGKYEFMLDVMYNLTEKWIYALIFGAGGIVGLLSFSKLLSWLLKKYRAETLALLTGLMFGAMYRPAKIVVINTTTSSLIFYSSILFIIGSALVIIIDRIANNKKPVKVIKS